jgi:hypothetical protein
MTLVYRANRLAAVFAATAILALSSPAFSQEIAPEHLQAARQAVDAINATDFYDGVLPQAAAALKSQLIQKNPDMQALVTSTVDEKTLALAARRSDLEREAALAYARVFPIDDLKAIAAFYNSEPGKKLIADGPIVSREVQKAAEIWQRGVARDLAEEVGKTLAAAGGQAVPAPEMPAPAAPVAPQQ